MCVVFNKKRGEVRRGVVLEYEHVSNVLGVFNYYYALAGTTLFLLLYEETHRVQGEG